jgi:gluconolactonase
MSEITMLASGLGFPEGPVVCADGSIVLVELRNNKCSRVSPDGAVHPFSNCGGGPNGLAIGPDGFFYLTNNGGNRYIDGHPLGMGPHPDYQFGYVQRIDPKTGEAKLLYKEANGRTLSAPNDLVFDKHGGFYFTDLGKRMPTHKVYGGLYYALPDGSNVIEVAYPILSPNGCGLSPDGNTIYVAETDTARLWAFDIEGPGWIRAAPRYAPHSGRIIGGLGGRAKFDSLKLLENGNIVVATLMEGCLTEFTPSGEVVRTVKTPDSHVTNLCFGGADMRTAYITLSSTGRLGVMQWPTPGLKLNFN